ncbi:hypothetical protein ACP4OV_027682 [Aristida adscensionis]
MERATTDASPHVLLVDDSPIDRLLASKVLKRLNIRVTAVEGPKEALKFLETEHDVKLILTNFRMPDMTGYDLLMQVKESPKLKHLPVVIASGDNIPERVQMCLNGGAKEYISKPVKEDDDVRRILSYI